MYRYLKNVFPKVEETMLLDILEQSDNNVQKASEKLIDLGYEKRNPTAPKSLRRKEEEQVIYYIFLQVQFTLSFQELIYILSSQINNEQTVPTPPPRMKSLEEKNKSRYI